MPEKHDLLAAILAAKEQGIRAILAHFTMAYLRGRYNGGAFTKTVIDGDVRHYRLDSFVTFSTSLDQYDRFNGVFMKYIGSKMVGSLSNASLLKKPE